MMSTKNNINVDYSNTLTVEEIQIASLFYSEISTIKGFHHAVKEVRRFVKNDKIIPSSKRGEELIFYMNDYWREFKDTNNLESLEFLRGFICAIILPILLEVGYKEDSYGLSLTKTYKERRWN